MQMFRDEVSRLLAAVVPVDKEQLAGDLENPPAPEMGDLAFPCFKLAKTLRKAPAAIAAELKDKLPASKLF
ncbi:MAG TPA: arginine--tRNA ligase, partial [Firmicutes bacterium]|nr:arginine--tRNA ligase [Bacillota bacterium]